MEIELTKNAKKSLAILYKEYCMRLKEGQSKESASSFSPCPANIEEDIDELVENGLIETDIIGNLELTKAAIVFMENKTMKTIKEWLSFGAQFIP